MMHEDRLINSKSKNHDTTALPQISSLEKLEGLRAAAFGHLIHFEDSPERVLSEQGMVYTTTIHIGKGSPIRAQGATREDAHEKAAKELVSKILDGAIIFSSRGKLEAHKNHRNKFKNA